MTGVTEELGARHVKWLDSNGVAWCKADGMPWPCDVEAALREVSGALQKAAEHAATSVRLREERNQARAVVAEMIAAILGPDGIRMSDLRGWASRAMIEGRP